MSGFEVAGLILGAVGLVAVFKEGHATVKKYRERRRQRRQSSNASGLEMTLHNGGTSVKDRYDNFHQAYGSLFAKGDSVARDGLKDLVILMQRDIIMILQHSITNKNSPLDIPRLTSVASTSADGALALMSELAQRLAIASPPKRFPSLEYGVPRVVEVGSDDESECSSESSSESDSESGSEADFDEGSDEEESDSESGSGSDSDDSSAYEFRRRRGFRGRAKGVFDILRGREPELVLYN
ncbi:hypothetical protein ABW19_dt0207896 [Dactylella cylindrospora]|nr:hypothetical protein ABW19_dt0207896 [Dactylella cylindrospora]